ncbi:MAG: bifunctional 4-hydroxy-2-oxoglutarate aldolase/2-dehydro-3-deoxy-phosphogluconate aldolase [Dehalococcoidia bacterium]|nr:bifunctional 4-hydroxy-2-oxoglutarate aldolase/2-dehydro-3-deoxy-phosphogluconate aldolase [Dehalococcoidia bacterium]
MAVDRRDVTRHREDLARQLLDQRLVAVIRTSTLDQARQAARAVIQGGIRLVEITMNVPDAPELIEELSGQAPKGVLVGAGSVVHAEQAKMAIGAGADFVVSPIRQVNLVRICHQVGVPCILGALTATEIVEAHRAGADQVKVFPVGLVGGPRYLQQILGPLPGLHLMASGGVTLGNFREYLAAGARTLVLGSDLFNPAWIEAGDYSSITRRAREYVQALAEG